MAHSELIELEERAWGALSSSGEAAVGFFGQILDRTALMLLPGGLVRDDRAAMLEAMSGQPWSRYDLPDMRVIHPAPDVGVLAYGVVALREGSPEYSALVSGTYVRGGDGWRLVLHQQTPR
jgi:hypothetical protein